MRLTDTQLVRAPLDATFDFYADPLGAGIVDPQARVTVLTSGPTGTGTRSRIEGRGRTFEVEITTFDPPGRLGFRMTHPGRPEMVDVTQRFAALSGATEVVSEAIYRYPGWLYGVLLALFRPIMQRRMRQESRRVAGVAEAHIRAGADQEG